MATTAATNGNGFEWRILLGPTHTWSVPELEFGKEQSGWEERCELCGAPIDQAKPFTTNSVGQQPMHVACSGGEEEADLGGPARKIWLHLLQSFISG